MDGIVLSSPVCQIEGGFLILRMEKCHGCSRERTPWRQFFWAPRKTVKIDGFGSLTITMIAMTVQYFSKTMIRFSTLGYSKTFFWSKRWFQ